MNASVLQAIPHILAAIGATLVLVGVSLFLSTVLGALLTPAAASRFRVVRLVIGGYSWLGRALPPLTLLISAYYGLSFVGVNTNQMVSAIGAFVFFATAYNIEIFRAAYKAVPLGQFEAARALGISTTRLQLGVILPQVARLAAPAYISNATIVLKDSSLASVVGVLEITAVTVRAVQADPDASLTLFSFLALIYLVLGSVLLSLEMFVDRHVKRA